MKKIMFSDEFLLTKAVLEGRKTQTRRLIKCRKTFKGEWVAGFNIHIRPSDKKVVGLPCMYDADESEFDGGEILPKYKVGEVVAVAQSYKDIYSVEGLETMDMMVQGMKNSKGWNNKMFVAAGMMIHRIRITNVRVERLQNISDEDCLKEGVVVNEPKIKGGINMYYPCEYLRSCAKEVGWGRVFHTPREAFAHLINKVSRKDVWSENPYVFVYDFELVK